ncbi:MAG TPA: PP2C family protein-serine/threonine phosphatase [Anaeromyxobacter sp.]
MNDRATRPAPVAAAARHRTPFEVHLDGLQHTWIGTSVMVAGVLVPLFVVLDWFTMPRELFAKFATYRAVATAFLVVQWIVIRFTRPSRWSILHGYAFTLVVAAAITKMTVDLGGYDSSYWAGLNLVIAANLLLPWSANHAFLNGTTTIVMYVLANAIWGGDYHPQSLIGNLFFMGAMMVIGIIISTSRFALIVAEFNSRMDLQEANNSLERSRADLKRARDALWGEMEVAKRIQTSLLPENRRVGAYDVAARMQPAAEVGGDYYDIIQAGEERNWIAIGDVSGHGVESGLVMMMTQTSILSLVHENPLLGPAEVFSAVNDVLKENISRLQAARYMTLNVVRLRDEGLTVAGKHQDVLVWRRATGKVETVANDGCWIGVVDDTRGRVGDQVIPMAEGDLALFYTDGATEAMNATGEMYGEARLVESLARVAEKPLEEALEALFVEIAAFRAVQDDDVTMMLVRRAPDRAATRPGEPGPAADPPGSSVPPAVPPRFSAA